MLRTTSALIALASVLVLPALSAADIEPYHATPVAPYHATDNTPAAPAAAEPAARSAQDVQPDQSNPIAPPPSGRAIPAPQPAVGAAASSRAASATNQPASAARKTGNPVEPLSNGLQLSMTQADIVAKFGEPTEHTFDARTFGYPSFGVQCGGRNAKIWHVSLKPGVRLSSGIGIGSTRADVARVFGPSPLVTVGQYKLSFRYTGDRVDQIGIEPANGEFAPAGKTALSNAPTGDAPHAAAARSLLGIWYSGTKGQIELKPDGTYDWSGRPAGRYTVKGNTVTFTGSLKPWNNGVGTVNARGDAIEFYWTTPEGAKQYFVFIR